MAAPKAQGRRRAHKRTTRQCLRRTATKPCACTQPLQFSHQARSIATAVVLTTWYWYAYRRRIAAHNRARDGSPIEQAASGHRSQQLGSEELLSIYVSDAISPTPTCFQRRFKLLIRETRVCGYAGKMCSAQKSALSADFFQRLMAVISLGQALVRPHSIPSVTWAFSSLRVSF